MKPKIVIVVEGGLVQEVCANVPVDVVVFDYDNEAAEGKTRDERDAAYDEATKDTPEVVY